MPVGTGLDDPVGPPFGQPAHMGHAHLGLRHPGGHGPGPWPHSYRIRRRRQSSCRAGSVLPALLVHLLDLGGGGLRVGRRRMHPKGGGEIDIGDRRLGCILLACRAVCSMRLFRRSYRLVSSPMPGPLMQPWEQNNSSTIPPGRLSSGNASSSLISSAPDTGISWVWGYVIQYIRRLQ